MPKKRPTPVDTVTPTMTALKGTDAVKTNWINSLTTRARMTPMRPPTLAITPASITNCQRMSRRRAPSDLRMPISWVRSVTLASHDQLLVERVDPPEEFLNDVLPDEADPRAVALVLLGDVAARLHFFPADVRMAGRDGGQRDLIDGVTLVARLRARLELRQSAYGLVADQVVLQELVVCRTDRLVATARFQEGLKTLRPLELMEDESVGA